MALFGGSDTPSSLAAEHAKAKAQYDTKRTSIIGRAKNALKDVRELASELEREAKQHLALLESLGESETSKPSDTPKVSGTTK